MLSALLKKQMMEIFRTYFYDAKKNKRRTKITTVIYMVLYALLMFGVIGGIFAYLAYVLCTPFASLGMSWMYFAILGLIAIFLGTFGSVFNTYSSLYLAKDNELLLSMPIPVQTIMTARLLSVYLMGLLYSAAVMIPTLIVYWICADHGFLTVLGGLLLAILVSIVVLILSCTLGWVVARISLKLKHRSFITVIMSLAFFAAYYFFYFKAQTIITELITNAVFYGTSIRGSAYPIYMFGRVGEGDVLSMIIVSIVILTAFALTAFVLKHSFLSIATSSSNTASVKSNRIRLQQSSPMHALLHKEFKRFTSSPTYMLNCGLGTLLLPAFGIFILVKGNEILGMFESAFGDSSGVISVIMCSIICLIVSMNDIAAPSISLEGKNLWILKSLPVKTYDILRAKLLTHLLLTSIPIIICSICAAVILKCTVLERVMIVIVPTVFSILMGSLALLMGLKFANFEWTSETIPVKQSMSVTIAILSGWVYSIAFGAPYVILGTETTLSSGAYLSIVAFVTATLAVGMIRLLACVGRRMFEEM